jgi:aspartate/methionine/tyrosine aminotransferase
MDYARMVIEKESPEEYGYDRIRYNLSESSVRDRKLSDFKLTVPDLLLPYGEHRGDPELRALVAAQSKGLAANDVLVTAGAAGALFIIATTLLSRDDHLVVVRPNYATNIETPRAIGCAISFIDLDFDKGFGLDVEKVAQAIRPNTRYVSVTCPHNPTGTMIDRTQLDALIALVEKAGCRLLVDETYRDLTHGAMLPLAASLSPNAISVASLSKAYGAPGIRIGWVVTRDAELMERFLAAKEQIGICGSVVDDWIAARILEGRDAFLAAQAPVLAARLAIMREWVANDELIEWVEPQGGVVCFPRFRHGPGFDFDDFYADLLESYGTYVGPGHWFEMPRNHMRIGFLYPLEDELRGGLAAISAAIRKHSARQKA